jgi:RNA polymerase sigma factor (TIGR02999 family)
MTPSSDPPGITGLLKAHRAGDRAAFDRLVPLVYQRLRAIARGQRAGGWAGRTLTTTGLVHEAYLDLVREQSVDWQDRSHFYAISARTMRRILVDYARRRSAQKRGGGQRPAEIDPDRLGAPGHEELVLAVDQAIDRMRPLGERLGQIVECRLFAGLTAEETAEALGVSLRTVERDWPRARAWLRKELGDGG